MQFLKDEVRSTIHQCALKEFYEKGYNDASMRSIAERVGMTVGNLYRYFPNKEDLFYQVISPAYHKLIELIQEDHTQIINLREAQSFVEYIAGRMVLINGQHREELLILMDGCSGTRFEHAQDEIVRLVENRLKNQLFPKLEEMNIPTPDEFFAHVLSVSIIEGMKAILKHYEDEKDMRGLITLFIRSHFHGIGHGFI
ncbi:MAG: TetR/AcrR family transcriptional regulator [Thermotaleaceae bacterium]